MALMTFDDLCHVTCASCFSVLLGGSGGSVVVFYRPFWERQVRGLQQMCFAAPADVQRQFASASCFNLGI